MAQVKKLAKIELIKILGYNPFKFLISLHVLFFLLGFFAIPRIRTDFPFLSMVPLYQFPHVWNFITWIGGFYNLTLVLLIIKLTCLEFTNKTYKHQVIFGLSRNELFYQKIILAAILSLYVLILTFGTIIISGMIYSYKISFNIIFDRSYVLLNTLLQTFTWLMTGVLFALIFKNMILSVLVFGFYRVIFEPIMRNLASDEASWFFPTKFITKLTPEPDIFKIVSEKLKTADQVSPEELSEYGRSISEGIPIWQNIILTSIFLVVILLITRTIFRRRSLT